MIIATDTAAMRESKRVMEICNACRYCEGLCATFQVMATRRTFTSTDLDYLANLCHNRTACFHNCQYAPPHAFDINVPAVLTDARVESYEKYAWPASVGHLFQRNGLLVTLVTAITLTLLLGLAITFASDGLLFGQHTGPGSFYRVVGQGLMIAVAGLSFGFSSLSMVISGVSFWRSTTDRSGLPGLKSIFSALASAATLKHLGGGHGEGCNSIDDSFSNWRRYFHQFTMWGFILCFASTCVAAVYDYALGLTAPFPFFSLPVLLGTTGGIGLVVGPAGLIWNRMRSDPRPMALHHYGMDYVFPGLLFLVSLTGLLLLALRDTSAMGIALIIHLGFVFSLFVTLPYSKFVHAIYRLVSLIRFATEQTEQKTPAHRRGNFKCGEAMTSPGGNSYRL